MEKSITLKDPIAVTFYGDDEPVVYPKIVLEEYCDPSNQGMILTSASGDDGEDLVATINLNYLIEPDIVIINVNDDLIKKQILPELIKRHIIEKEPCGNMRSGFVTYPAYQLLIKER